MKIFKKVEKELRVCICDFCGDEMTRYTTCCGCGKDVCEKCGNLIFYDLWDDSDYGDYPEIICDNCLNIGSPYFEKAKKITNEADEKVEKLKSLWKILCERNK